MEAMRQSWTDDRLDDFRGEVNRRFDGVDRKFDEVGKRFDEVDVELHRVTDRLDSLGRAMIFAAIAFTSATLAGWASVIALVLTQT